MGMVQFNRISIEFKKWFNFIGRNNIQTNKESILKKKHLNGLLQNGL